jgi:hypothetical protein
MTVKPEGQVDQELHLEHWCASSSRLPPAHGDHRRDDIIADNVGTTRSQSGGPAEAR